MLGNSLAKLTDTPNVLCTPSGLLPWQDAPPSLGLSAAQGLLILWPTDYPMVGLQDIIAPHLSQFPCSFWKETQEKKKVGEPWKQHVAPSSFVSRWGFKVENQKKTLKTE